AVAVLARLPFLAADPSKDEAGFLMVGQQWHAAGKSLYGNYWVDRPPLLITIFRAADQLGGLLPLRLIGCVATVLIVLGAARVARRLGGPGAAAWAALTAAALCVSPLLGGQSVNGELLAAPFVVGGIAAVLITVDHPTEGRSALAAGLAGAATMAAVLVKQNMADVAVFAGVVLLLAWWRGEITSPRLIRSVLGYVSGAVLCLGVVTAWTMAHGTSLVGVFDAMYPFRIDAVHVMAASNRQVADARLWVLLTSWAISGGAVIMGVLTWALLSSRLRGAAVWGLIATVLFDAVSIALGGSYWSHYLIQLVVPTAVISGLLVARRAPAARTVLTSAALAAAIALGVALTGTHTSIGSSVGQAVGRVAGPRDTIVTAWGHADLTRASGLGSPYPYLWSLPARTLDPRFAALDELLSGPSAPTWFVTWSSVHSWVGHPDRVVIARLLAARYHPVAHLDGRTVYLRRGVQRATPQLSRATARHPNSPDGLSSATSPKETP
ncbi:MAG: hypothetical protein ABIW17_06175, partial [Marmoricola sp.]